MVVRVFMLTIHLKGHGESWVGEGVYLAPVSDTEASQLAANVAASAMRWAWGNLGTDGRIRIKVQGQAFTAKGPEAEKLMNHMKRHPADQPERITWTPEKLSRYTMRGDN